VRALGERGTIHCWSAGCASGEEPYSIAILWAKRVQPAFPRARLRIVATDTDAQVLRRAREARYPAGTLRELPAALVEASFRPGPDGYLLRPELREDIEFLRQDLRLEQPHERFHLVLCRNLAFTYFDPALQRVVLDRIAERTLPNGFLVLGHHESIPPEATGWVPWKEDAAIYCKGDEVIAPG
jgi:chemotaxis protein methyltransferase CheR